VLVGFSFLFGSVRSLAGSCGGGLDLFGLSFQVFIQPLTVPIASVRIWRIPLLVSGQDFCCWMSLETVMAIEV
jgi:hypothetical protein